MAKTHTFVVTGPDTKSRSLLAEDRSGTHCPAAGGGALCSLRDRHLRLRGLDFDRALPSIPGHASASAVAAVTAASGAPSDLGGDHRKGIAITSPPMSDWGE
jgi:hypothetical protein